jgi:hypothetical protein
MAGELMRTLIAIAVLFTTLSLGLERAFAESAMSKSESPTFALLEKMGMRQMLADRREEGKKSTIKLFDRLVDQLKAQDPDISDEIILALRASLAEAADTIINAYSIDEALAVYAEPFDREYSPKKLKDTIKEMSKPEHVRELKIVNEASMRMGEFIQRKQNEAAEKAVANALAQIKEAVAVAAREQKLKKRAVTPANPTNPAK